MKIELDQVNSKIYEEKRWDKYYSYDRDSFSFPETTIFNYLKECNKNNLCNYGINYFGVKLTYQQIFDKIDECFNALIEKGVKEGDIVSICMPTTPESVIAYYAINKLGAVSNFIDVRRNSEEIKYCINNTNSKLLLTLDSIIEKINKIVDQTSLDKMVYISPFDSFPGIIKNTLKLNDKLKNHNLFVNYKDSGYQSWKKFLQTKDVKLVPDAKYSKNKLAIIQYSSGTTGIPKAISLTDNSVNNRVYQYMNNGMVHSVGDVYMDIIPIFIAFGAVVGIHLPLCMGMEDALIPAYNEEEVVKLLQKYKPKHFTLTPSSYNYLINHPDFYKLDFADKLTLACGGDGMNANENIVYNQKLEEQNSCFNINNGYGASEIGAPFCTEKNGVYKPGSVGIPLPGNEVVIFKHGTFESLSYNQVGDICMIVDSPMNGYYNNEELTNKVMYKLENGKTAIILGDCGYVDEDGFIFVKGRYENIIISETGNEIWPVDIESYIYSYPFIKNCAVSALDSSNRINVFITIKDVNKYTNDEIISIIFENLKLKFLNVDFNINIIDKLPLTSSGKIDRKLLRTLQYDTVEKTKIKK